MSYFNKKIHVYACNLSIFWSPLKTFILYNEEFYNYRWTWIWRTTVRRIFAYDGGYAWSQSNAYQVFVICIWQILHMTDQFSWSHWVRHIQVHLYNVLAPTISILAKTMSETMVILSLDPTCPIWYLVLLGAIEPYRLHINTALIMANTHKRFCKARTFLHRPSSLTFY